MIVIVNCSHVIVQGNLMAISDHGITRISNAAPSVIISFNLPATCTKFSWDKALLLTLKPIESIAVNPLLFLKLQTRHISPPLIIMLSEMFEFKNFRSCNAVQD